MSWSKKRVFVTGAGGFIGSHLCEALVTAGAHVTALVHYNCRDDRGNLNFTSPDVQEALKVVQGDIQDSHLMSKTVKDFDVIFHLAALIPIPYSYSAPLSYVRTNVEGTLNLLETVRAGAAGKLIHTSTSEVYGTALQVPISESHPLQAQSPYSASKIGADKLVESYCLSFAVPAITVRPFNTYGPRQSARAIIPTIITQCLNNESISLGALDPVRDFTFVSDTACGFMQAALNDQLIGKVVNIGSGKGISINDLAIKILALMQMSKPIVSSADRLRPAQSEVYKLICDNAFAINSFDWKPQVGMEEGLRQTIEFITANNKLFRNRSYVI